MTTPDISTAAAALGHRGGLSTSKAKQDAARENGRQPTHEGKKRGRPRKETTMKYKGYEISVTSGTATATAKVLSKQTGAPIYSSGQQPSRDQAIGKAQEYIDYNLTKK